MNMMTADELRRERLKEDFDKRFPRGIIPCINTNVLTNQFEGTLYVNEYGLFICLTFRDEPVHLWINEFPNGYYQVGLGGMSRYFLSFSEVMFYLNYISNDYFIAYSNWSGLNPPNQ